MLSCLLPAKSLHAAGVVLQTSGKVLVGKAPVHEQREGRKIWARCAMFRSRILSDPDATIWSCHGALDSYSSEVARKALVELPKCDVLVVDLTDCDFVDAGGLRILQEAAALCKAGKVIVRIRDYRIWDLMRITGLDECFEVRADHGGESVGRVRRIRDTSGHRTTYRSYKRTRLTHRASSSV